MVRYLRRPQQPRRLIRAEEDEEAYDQDKPCIYELEVDGPAATDTGLVDEEGSSIMRSPDPIGFLHFDDD